MSAVHLGSPRPLSRHPQPPHRLDLGSTDALVPDVMAADDALSRQPTQSNGLATSTFVYDASTLQPDTETIAYDLAPMAPPTSPAPDMDSSGSPTGRRSDTDTRIYLIRPSGCLETCVEAHRVFFEFYPCRVGENS